MVLSKMGKKSRMGCDKRCELHLGVILSLGRLLLLRCSARGGGSRHKNAWLPRDFHARKQTLKGNLQALVVFGSQDL